MMRSKSICFLLLGLCLSTACSDSDNSLKGPNKGNPSDYKVNGKVEKGPFVSGSTIYLKPLDAKMQEMGTLYKSQLKDNQGSFDFGSKSLTSPYAELSISGYFFNEVKGELSSGPISLMAVADLANQSTVNVNLLTHLKYYRILKLIKNGKSFNEANKMAQHELLSAFGLQKYEKTDVTQYTITSGTDEAAALIAVSSLLLNKRTEAEFTEYLSKLSNEFGENGQFSAAIQNQMKTDRDIIGPDLDYIAENIISRYKEFNVEVNVKDLFYYFDWDDDGIAGNELVKESYVKLETEEFTIPAKGGRFEINIDTNNPRLYFEKQDLFGEDNDDNICIAINDIEALLNYGPISFEKEIKDNKLILTVKPTSYRMLSDQTIKIYNYRNEVLAQLHIKQEPNLNESIFNATGHEMIQYIQTTFSNAESLITWFDSKYSSTFLKTYQGYILRDLAVQLYVSITANSFLTKFNSYTQCKELDVYLNTLNALNYYLAASYWSKIPYQPYDTFNISDFTIQQIPEKAVESSSRIPYASTVQSAQVMTKVEYKLAEILDLMKKNPSLYQEADFGSFSMDVVKVALAKVYIEKQEYRKAKNLLYEIAQSRKYQLERNNLFTQHSLEVIWALPKPTIDLESFIKESAVSPDFNFNNDNNSDIDPLTPGYTRSTRVSASVSNSLNFNPVFVYSDVILLLAECEYALGNTTAAKDYLNKICTTKNIQLASNNVLMEIKEARKLLLKDYGGYYLFLRRNNLAQSELSLSKDHMYIGMINTIIGH